MACGKGVIHPFDGGRGPVPFLVEDGKGEFRRESDRADENATGMQETRHGHSTHLRKDEAKGGIGREGARHGPPGIAVGSGDEVHGQHPATERVHRFRVADAVEEGMDRLGK